MRPANYLPEPSLLASTFLSLAYLAAPVFGQNGGGGGGGGGGGDDEDETSAPAPAPAPAPTTAPEPAPVPSDDTEETSEVLPAPPSTEAETSTEEPESTTAEPETSPEAETSTSVESSTEPESTSTEETSTTTEAPDPTPDTPGSGPNFSLTRNPGAPEYPAPTVPPTINAPFMQQSTAPEGTVFIAVGAILGAFALGVLLWSMITRVLLHRSVERASKAQHDETTKSGFPAPPAPFYKYTDNGSNMSLSAAGRGVRRTTRGPGVPSSNPSTSNLFFSPTAASTNAGGNRGSAFLPSGFYAAGNSSPGPGHQHSISLTNLRPDSRGHHANASRHTLNPSPPDSPHFPMRRDMSNSSLNLNVSPAGQRAPSAYLEDLLADDPSSLPPPHMPPSNGPRPSSRNL